MSEFDFLKQHGFGVVYGAEAVHNKIKELAMSDNLTENTKTNENDGDNIANEILTATDLNKTLSDEDFKKAMAALKAANVPDPNVIQVS